jgi:hypothetical protein
MILTGDDAELSETSTATNFHQLKMTPPRNAAPFSTSSARPAISMLSQSVSA